MHMATEIMVQIIRTWQCHHSFIAICTRI